MGSVHQRLEVLLIGLMLLLVGVIVVGLTVLRPAVAGIAALPTPAPLSTRSAVQSTPDVTTMPTVAPATIATTSMPTAITAPSATAQTSTERMSSVTMLAQVQPALRAAWPWLLLAVGSVGNGLLVLRWRRRRRSVAKRLSNTVIPQTRTDHPQDLAASAGMALFGHQRRRRWPAIRLPQLAHVRPYLRLPTLRLPNRLRWRQNSTITGRLAIFTLPAPVLNGSGSNPSLNSPRKDEQPIDPPPLTIGTMSSAITDSLAFAEPLEAHLVELPEIEDADQALHTNNDSLWTAEDRVLAVAGVLAAIWVEQDLSSPVVAFDTPQAYGDGLVLVTLDQHPDEEQALLDLAEHIRRLHPIWSVAWRRELLAVTVVGGHERPPSGGPLVVPILAHGRGGRTTRYYPLASWRHLGIYGGNALGALHALLGSLLFTQPPSNLALGILDPSGIITPLYQDVAHLVALPGSARETLEQLAQAIRRQTPRGEPQPNLRPLLLVVVEPDEMLLNMLIGIAARLRTKPATPVHLLVVQAHVSNAGREVYAQLPALITSGGRGTAALLPGQGDWPSGEAARLVGRGMRVEGRAITVDEIAIGVQLQQLRGQVEGLPPVLWEQAARELPSGARAEPAALPDAARRTSVGGELDAERRQRLYAAMIARRQTLMENDGAVAPVRDHIEREAEEPQRAIGIAVVDDRVAPNGSGVVPEQPDQIEAVTPDDIIPIARAKQAPNGTDGHLSAERAADLLASPIAALAEADQDDEGGVDRPAASISTDTPEGDHLSRAAARLGHSWERGEAPIHLPARPASHQITDAGDAAISTEPAAPAPMVEPENGWPPGPAPLGRLALAELLGRVVVAPAIVAGQSNELGVTKNRLVELLKTNHRGQAKELAEILVVWFDLAGLLVEPTRPGRLRHPRALITTDLTAIAERLNAVPCPDRATVQQAWAASNEGSA